MPAVFWLLVTGQTKRAFVLFIIAGVSDAVDGFLAKRFGWQTELGAYLDPLADKLLIVSIFLALGVDGKLPLWLVIAVVSRDILIVIAVVLSWLLGNPVRIRPLIVSKANTVAQIVLAATVLADEGFGLGLDGRALRAGMDDGRADLRIARCLFAQLAAHMSGYESPGAARAEQPLPVGGTSRAAKRCASNGRCCSGWRRCRSRAAHRAAARRPAAVRRRHRHRLLPQSRRRPADAAGAAALASPRR